MCTFMVRILNIVIDDPEKVASAAETDVSQLHAIHEEADTRILRHAVDATAKGYERLIISAQCTETQMFWCCFLSSHNI